MGGGVGVMRSYRTLLALAITFTILMLVIIMPNGFISLSELASLFTWDTLGGNVYRSAFVVTPPGAMTLAPTARWTADLTGQHYGVNVNPLVVDINRDGVMEVVFVDSSGTLVVVRGDTGAILLTSYLGLSAYSTPAAYDVDGGWLELIAVTGFSEVVALKFPTAWSVSVMWRFRVPVDSISSSPLVYDVDGDGVGEVFVSTSVGLYCLRASDGVLKWFFKSYGRVFLSSPVLLDDVNGDGSKDVAHITGYPPRVYVVNGRDGMLIRSWDLWGLDSRFVDMIAVHSPASADVDGDGVRDVIVSVGREVFRTVTPTYKTGSMGYIVVLNPVSGAYYVASLTGYSLYTWFAQPAIAVGDTDGDGRAEIIVASEDSGLYFIKFVSGGLTVTFIVRLETYYYTWTAKDTTPRGSALVVADIDGDGVLEAITLTITGTARVPLQYILRATRLTSPYTTLWTVTLPVPTGYSVRIGWPSIALGDIDNDGRLEIVVAAYDRVLCYDR
jgi:hypothetical protein